MDCSDSILILYDGNCPICCRKIEFLKRHDHENNLLFENIRAPEFQAEMIGVPFSELAKQIHAVLPDGSVVSRMEVIRAAYRQIGLGWLIAPTDWPVLRFIFDRLYGFVAKHRLFISRLFGKSKI